MKVLVTGGAGYLGCVLVEELLARGYEVTVLDNLLYDQDQLAQHSWRDNFRFVPGDVRNVKLLEDLTNWADVIFPLAAIVGFPACERDPDLAEAVNSEQLYWITRNLKPHQKLIYPNTNSGYGLGQGQASCTEESPLTPISVYGQTKCAAEGQALTYGGIVLRLATVFGVSPRMRMDLLVNDFTWKAVTDGYIVLFEKDFKRNYIHIRDVARAFMFMMDNYQKHTGQVFNLGLSDANLSKWELAQKIKEHVPNFSVQCDDIRSDPDKRNYIVSNEKIEAAGWKPQFSLDYGIKELIKAYKVYSSLSKRYTNV